MVRPFELDSILIGGLCVLRSVGIAVPWTPDGGVVRSKDYDKVAKMVFTDFKSLLSDAIAANPARLKLLPKWAGSAEMLRAAITKNPGVRNLLTPNQTASML